MTTAGAPSESDAALATRLAIDTGHLLVALRERLFAEGASRWEIKDSGDELLCGRIAAELHAHRPSDAVLSEEGREDPRRFDHDRVWIIDPLDGTKEFINRRGDFTVNIALVENGVPTRGVVYAPAKDRMFFTLADGTTVEEAGPFQADKIGEPKPIRVSDPNNGALMVVASKSHRDQATDDYISQYNVRDMTSAGSSMKFCLIAAGEADLYPRLGRTMEWDTAAADAVLRGAGGQVVRFDDLTPLTYGKEGYANPFFIAHAPGVDLKSA